MTNELRGARPSEKMNRNATIPNGTRTKNADGSAIAPCVYRFFDASGVLLYIGTSTIFLQRMVSHQRLDWFSDIADIKLAHYETEEQARIAEKLAIYDERPRYNIYYTGDYHYQAVKEAARRRREERIARDIEGQRQAAEYFLRVAAEKAAAEESARIAKAVKAARRTEWQILLAKRKNEMACDLEGPKQKAGQ